MSLGVRLTDGSEARVNDSALSPADILESQKSMGIEFEDGTLAWVNTRSVLCVIQPPVVA